MPATEWQAQAGDALEIAVSDAGSRPEPEPERGATITLLPLPWPASLEPEADAIVPELGDYAEGDEDGEWGELGESEGENEGENLLLEPSGVTELEAARSGAGLGMLDVLGEDYEGEPELLLADVEPIAKREPDDGEAITEVDAELLLEHDEHDEHDEQDAGDEDEDDLASPLDELAPLGARGETHPDTASVSLLGPDAQPRTRGRAGFHHGLLDLLAADDLDEFDDGDELDPDPGETLRENVIVDCGETVREPIFLLPRDDEDAVVVSGEIEAAAELDDELDDEVDDELDDEPEVVGRPDPIRVPLWSGINTAAYAFARGLRGMGQSPLVQLLAVGTMAVCMLLLGTTMLIFQNARRVAHDLGVDTPVTVYMQPAADPAAAEALRERIAALPEVARVEHVTPEMALAQLQDGLGTGAELDDERAELLSGIDASVLPASVEVELVDGVEPGFADALADRVAGMEGVDEVAVLGPWVQEVERMLATLRWLAFGVAGLVSLACLAIVWSTIRLGVFARRSELQILRLVGGTARFVRSPFVVEGVLQGVLGTALALACLWLSFELIRPFLERGMSLMFAAGSLKFFSVIEMLVALGFGALLGIIGSRAAVARHTEA